MDSSGADNSGPSRFAYDAVTLNRLDGFTVRRPAYDDSVAPSRSKFQRFSSGSRALNAEPSSFHRLPYSAPVTTPNVMWVASCQWCPMFEIGSFIADGRC